jgi:serine/threonine protein kinase
MRIPPRLHPTVKGSMMSQIASQVSVTAIGNYQILEKIGKGGMGTVYKGQDRLSKKIVAIKVMTGEVASDSVRRMRFAQECQVTQKLNHPHIVRVLDFGLDGSKPYLVMEFVDGESLGQRIQRKGRLPEAEAVHLIRQVGQALHWAHQCRLIHRDVKPDNILLTVDGKAKLADLGLVKNLESEYALTQTMSTLGTPNFMAPEQFEDAKRADAQSDLYSLAATLYMMVTGELPFRTRSTRALTTIYKKKLNNEISSPRQLVPDLSERIDRAILQALQADRTKRQPCVLDFVESLADPTLSRLNPVPEPASKESPKTPSEEQRSKKRYSSLRGSSCRPLQRAPEKPWVGQVANISENGLCLEIGRRFERGTLLTVVLKGPQASRRSLVVRVVWVKKQSSQTWRIGCQFDRPLCDFEVTELC